MRFHLARAVAAELPLFVGRELRVRIVPVRELKALIGTHPVHQVGEDDLTEIFGPFLADGLIHPPVPSQMEVGDIVVTLRNDGGVELWEAVNEVDHEYELRAGTTVRFHREAQFVPGRRGTYVTLGGYSDPSRTYSPLLHIVRPYKEGDGVHRRQRHEFVVVEDLRLRAAHVGSTEGLKAQWACAAGQADVVLLRDSRFEAATQVVIGDNDALKTVVRLLELDESHFLDVFHPGGWVYLVPAPIVEVWERLVSDSDVVEVPLT